MYPIVHCSTIYNSQNMEANQMSIDRWIKRLCYIYTMEYYSAIKRNTFESVLMRWMNLEPIIQSEVSQKVKDKYCILIHIYGIQKNGTDTFIYREAMEKQTQRIDLWTWGKEEMYGKSNMETYITLCKQIVNRNLLYESGNSNWGCVSTQRGGMGREMEGGSKGRRYIYIPMADSC